MFKIAQPFHTRFDRGGLAAAGRSIHQHAARTLDAQMAKQLSMRRWSGHHIAQWLQHSAQAQHGQLVMDA